MNANLERGSRTVDAFVIGATGLVSGAIARHLKASGHRVHGLARSEDAARRLSAMGVQPVLGDLGGGRAAAVAAARDMDAVVYAAQVEPNAEVGVVAELLDAAATAGATFLFTSGSGVLLQRTAGGWSPDSFAEEDAFVVEPLAASRLAAENLVRDAAGRGARAMVVRPGMVWGPGGHGHVSMVQESVARTGSACYVGSGLNTYSHVHIDDVGRLFGAVLERGRPGRTYHASAGETPVRWIAERVAVTTGVDTRSLTGAEAIEVWGEFGALIASASSRLRDSRTRQELGWQPQHHDMLDDAGAVLPGGGVSPHS